MEENKKTKKINYGKLFEQSFADSFPDNAFIYRLRDSGSTYGGMKNNNLRFSVTNMCDFIAFNQGTLYVLELKTTKGKSLPFSNIKGHQMQEMKEAGSKAGVKAYFIINFRELEETYIITADKVIELFEEDKVKSISVAYCRDYGRRLRQELKRTRYTYNIQEDLFKILL